MKLIKISFAFLLLAIIYNIAFVKAYYTVDSIMTSVTLSGSNIDYSDYFTKADLGQQSYYTGNTYTALNNPCTGCIVSFRIQNENGQSNGMNTTIGERKWLNDGVTGNAGNYRLLLQRHNSGLINTYHVGRWYLMPIPSI